MLAVERGGGAEGDRTPDLLIANEALSQLSYGPATQTANEAADARFQRDGAIYGGALPTVKRTAIMSK
jgi:hypothetical protein